MKYRINRLNQLFNCFAQFPGHVCPGLAMATSAPSHGQVAFAKQVARIQVPRDPPEVLDPQGAPVPAPLASHQTPLGHGLAPPQPWPGLAKDDQANEPNHCQ